MKTRFSRIQEIVLLGWCFLSVVSALNVGCFRETRPKTESTEQLDRDDQMEYGILEATRISPVKDYIVDEANSITEVVAAIRSLKIDSVRVVQGSEWVTVPVHQGELLIECLENVKIFNTNDSREYIVLPSKIEFQFIHNANGTDLIPLSVNIVTDSEIFVGHLLCTTENPLIQNRLSELRALGASLLAETQAKETRLID